LRGINDRFVSDLIDGELSFFLKKVKDNRALLSIEIRDGYINIYYKGGNLLKITQKAKGYSFYFDAKYCIHQSSREHYEMFSKMKTASANEYINNWELMMGEMDSWFNEHPKPERTYQHNLLVNNRNILDIEYQINFRDVDNKSHAMRFDMIMLNNSGITVVENKYGNGAIGGSAGLSKHYNDICNVLNDDALHEDLLSSMRNIAKNKKALGLIDYDVPEFNKAKTKILFLLADYNQRSALMKNERDLLVKSFPADVLMTANDEYKIDMSKAKDFFTYGD